MQKISKNFLLLSFLLLSLFSTGVFVFASESDGTIDSTYKYSWGENIGWINFGATNGNVHILDDELTGYAWAEQAGWISLNCSYNGDSCGTDYQVSNDGEGNLSGSAYNEITGYVSFNPTNGGVIINSSGVFTGSAWGENIGWISFDCTNCQVLTDWRPQSSRGGSGGDDPDPPTHYVCSASEQCILVSGSGSNQCSIDNDCATHNICNNQKQCVFTSGVGIDQCQTGSDCNIIHNECNDSQQCAAVDGVGIDQCQDNSDCVITKHNECNDSQQCAAVDGVGSDRCLTDDDCVIIHFECNIEKQCVQVYGVGINQCGADDDCKPDKHNECNDSQQCVAVDGAGSDLCQTNADCLVYHTECQNHQCASVVGVGVNQCNSNLDCVSEKHNVCNDQLQCISVDGEGDDQCQTSNDCQNGNFIGSQQHTVCSDEKCVIVDGSGSDKCDTDYDCETLVKKTVVIITGQIEKIKIAGQKISEIVNTPQGSVTTKIITTTGIAAQVVVATSVVIFSPLSIFEILFTPLRLLGALLGFIKFRKKIKPWGVVYDSVTKQPIDPAYVVLQDLSGKNIATAITDMDGRYGFIASPGKYKIVAHKTNYTFPSKKLVGKDADELYNNLYFGEEIEVKDTSGGIIKSIPLDPVKFDWNEFAKRDKGMMKFYSKLDRFFGKISTIFFVIGFMVAIIAYFVSSYPYNFVILVIYLILLLLRILGLKPRPYGRIIEKNTGNLFSFAVIKIFIPDINKEVSHKVADQYGRYYCLVPRGKYYVKIEKKNEDETYSLIYTSGVIDASKKGIIRENFKI